MREHLSCSGATPMSAAFPMLALVLLAACGEHPPAPPEAAAPSASASVEAPSAPPFRWVVLEQAAPDLDARVAEHARVARAEALLPTVHLSTTWNTGGTLRQHKDHPEVKRALEGIYLI